MLALAVGLYALMGSMLRDWLDVHLQGIVERLVRREVERIARRAELG